MPTPTYIPLGTITLSSTDSEIVFSNISSGYRDLILAIQHKGAGDNFTIRLNSDATSGNYSFVYMLGNGSSASSASGSGGVIGASYTGNLATTIVQVMDYSATDKHKTVLSRNDTAGTNTRATAARWANTAAVTSLGIHLNSGSFDSGSTFSLYGIN